MFIAQAFFGRDRVWSVAIFTMALTINGAVTAGYLGNGLDIAPNFSGMFHFNHPWLDTGNISRFGHRVL